MGWGALAQGLIGLVGESHAREQASREETLRRQALARILGIPEPELERVAPELLGPSAEEGVQADPELVAQQRAVLSRLLEMSKGGLDIADRSALEDALAKSARNDAASRSAIANQFAARGQLGSGAELAMQLANQQQSSDQAHNIGMRTAADAQRRAYEALSQSGTMAGRLRDQGVHEAARRAQAKDAIAKYNNAAINRGRERNASLGQQQFDNRLRLQAAAGGAGSGLAGMYNQRTQQERDFWGGMGRAANEATKGWGQDRWDSGDTSSWSNPYGDSNVSSPPNVSADDDDYFHMYSPSRLGRDDEEK